MKKIYFIAVLLIPIVSGMKATAQDIHFSQFYAAPLYLNPANTGFFDGNYRLTAIYRNQWNSVTVPYQTVSGSLDFSVPTGPARKDMFGIGFMSFADKAGDSHLTTTQYEVSAAYSKCFDRYGHNYFSVGIQGGYVNSTIDYQSLSFDENFEGGATTENFAANTSGYPDVSAGIAWNYLANKQENFNIGLSMSHINQPAQTFMGDATSTIYRKISLNAGATLPIGPNESIYPKINYMVQGPNTELEFGGFGRFGFKKKADNEYAIYLGVLNRMNDAIIFLTRFDINNFAFTFSYDFNYSKLAFASEGLGGPELSIMYIGAFSKNKKAKVYCPKF